MAIRFRLITSTAAGGFRRLAILIALLVPALPGSAAAATFTVTTTVDSGAGSLRQAILDTNASAGADEIRFDIPGAGPHTIRPQTAFPDVAGPVTIDGLTQPGADCSSWPATLRIELDGSAVATNPFGLTLSGGSSIVRGLVISGFDGVSNASAGIRITSSGNLVACNFLGTNVSGTAGTSVQENESAILIDGGNGNTIGGATPSARNLIANSDDNGILLRGGSTANVIVGNFIGTNVAGTGSLDNFNAGVLVLDAPGTIIGGTDHDAGVCNRSCNLVSGNNSGGIIIDGEGGDGTVIQGNFIGPAITGTTLVLSQFGNRVQRIGIEVDAALSTNGSSGHLIGGARPDPGRCSGACNLISGNASEGIRLDDRVLQDITVRGNFIGTDASGMSALSNINDGIHADGIGHLIGGSMPGEGNLISGNEDNGIDLKHEGSVVQGNLIGTAIDGISPIGNGEHGISVTGLDKRIGGTTTGEGNTIAFNGGAGVFHNRNLGAPEDVRNAILGNAIFGNAGIGINLCVVISFQCDNATANDAGDADEGANRLQNFPEIAAVGGDGAHTLTVTYVVPSSTASSAYPLRIEFFLADADGEEGQVFLGADSYTTAEAQQLVPMLFSPMAFVADGALVLGTATDAQGNTSEFSTAVAATGSAGPAPIFADGFDGASPPATMR